MTQLSRTLSACIAPMAAASLLAGCAPSQYAGSIANFSTAVRSANVADQAYVQAGKAAQTRQINHYLAANPHSQVEFSGEKCFALHGYKAGDCALKVGPFKVMRDRDPATQNLVAYAEALDAVVHDKNAATFGTDVGNLGAALQGLAASQGASRLAADTGPITTIVAQLGGMAIRAQQVAILRKATAAADPLVQQLAATIGDRDANLARMAIEVNLEDLRMLQAQFKDSANQQAADLAPMVALAASIDTAQQVDPAKALRDLAEVHGALTRNLANPTVDWGTIQSNAQMLAQSLQAVAAAAQVLANTSAATPSH